MKTFVYLIFSCSNYNDRIKKGYKFSKTYFD